MIDVRLVPSDRLRGQLNEFVADGLIVGKMRPGTLFGYDRHASQGPWVIRQIIRYLHRDTGYVSWSDVERVDWEAQVVRLRVDDLAPLAPAR